MIDGRCKRREALSRAALIGRALPPLTQGSRSCDLLFDDPLRCAAPRAPGRNPPLTTECPSLVSDHGGGGTPGPIPNPEVKPPSADGTAEWSVGEQDVADQRGAFACRGPRHPGGGGALLRMAGRSDPFSLSSMPLPAGGSFPAVPPAADVTRRRPVPRAAPPQATTNASRHRM